MSTLLERPIESQPQLQRPVRQARRRQGVARTSARISGQGRHAVAERASVVPVAAGRACCFLLVMGVAYASSSLAGHVLVEGARQERIQATGRASEARASEALLAKKLEVLADAAAIERWAASRGFKAPYGLDESRKLLARR